MFWVLKDVVFLLFHVAVACFCILRDRFVRARYNTLVLPVIGLEAVTTPQGLSKLLRRNFVSVVDSRKQSKDKVIGDDAVGTDRAWIKATTSDNTTLDLFVKVPTKKLWLNAMLQFTGLYDNEVSFYQSTAPCLKGHLNMPEVHYARKAETNFVIILEDLSASGCKLMNLFETCSKAQCIAVLDMLAHFHAQFWNNASRVWSESRRPPFVRLLVELTFVELNRRFPNLLPPDVAAVYKKFVKFYPKVRQFWSREPTTFVHGDTHNGNVYFDREGKPGFYDFQVVSCESPIRDVTYFLQMSCDPDMLAKEEKFFVEHYISQLNKELDKQFIADSNRISLESAWFQYRTHTLYSLLACVVTCGAGNFVQHAESAIAVSNRSISAVKRLRVAEALDDILTGKV